VILIASIRCSIFLDDRSACILDFWSLIRLLMSHFIILSFWLNTLWKSGRLQYTTFTPYSRIKTVAPRGCCLLSRRSIKNITRIDNTSYFQYCRIVIDNSIKKYCKDRYHDFVIFNMTSKRSSRNTFLTSHRMVTTLPLIHYGEHISCMTLKVKKQVDFITLYHLNPNLTKVDNSTWWMWLKGNIIVVYVCKLDLLW